MTKTASVGLAEAKNKFSELIERVNRGEEFTITRHEEAIARLIPARRPSRELAQKAIEAMRSLRASNPVKVTTKELASWKNEGRH